jgi:FdhD protein
MQTFLDGHLVLGHIDGIGEIINIEKVGEAYNYRFRTDEYIFNYLVEKDSLAIDGISLTIFNIKNRNFEVAIIPETINKTNLKYKKVGSIVNLEINIFAKYGKKFLEKEVELIIEQPLTIYLNDREFITLLCYPENVEELTVGFLKSEGLIFGKEDILKINVSKDNLSVYVDAKVPKLSEKLYEKRIVTTGCGKGSIFYFALDSLRTQVIDIKKKWSYKLILEKMHEVNKTKGSKSLGGLHVCGLFNGEQFFIREDVGRHNALDKIVGHCILQNINYDDCIVFTTGRISSEILLKASKINAGVVVSRSTPTNLAYDIAEKLNITIIGYVRGNLMTIYTAKDRIIMGNN